jgi:hypothetical protein
MTIQEFDENYYFIETARVIQTNELAIEFDKNGKVQYGYIENTVNEEYTDSEIEVYDYETDTYVGNINNLDSEEIILEFIEANHLTIEA